jgi:uncharacterized protein YbjT (DUF2867 family)
MSLPGAIASGSLFAAAEDGGAAYVTREDCARAAAATLASDFDGKRQIEITGPDVVTYGELASIASELTGKEVAYIPVDEESLVAGMTARHRDQAGAVRTCDRCGRGADRAAADKCQGLLGGEQGGAVAGLTLPTYDDNR